MEESGHWAGFQKTQEGRKDKAGEKNALQGQRAVDRTLWLKCEFEEGKYKAKIGNGGCSQIIESFDAAVVYRKIKTQAFGKFKLIKFQKVSFWGWPPIEGFHMFLNSNQKWVYCQKESL